MTIELQQVADAVQQNYVPFLVGALVSRPVILADLLFQVVIRSPLKYVLLTKRTRQTINSWIDAFQAEINKKAEAEEAAAEAGKVEIQLAPAQDGHAKKDS